MIKITVSTATKDELLHILRLLHPVTHKARVRSQEKNGKHICWIQQKD